MLSGEIARKNNHYYYYYLMVVNVLSSNGYKQWKSQNTTKKCFDNINAVILEFTFRTNKPCLI